MEMTSVTLVVAFFVLLLLNVPISISIGVATLLAMVMSMDIAPATITIAQRMAGGLNSFALLAIPFFVLSGLIMGRGGIAKRLIECAMALIGALPGGLALVNVVSCMLFGAISGSAVAATSAIGSFMLPEMKKAGYEPNFSAALTAAASTTGMLIPPSNILIVYAIASGGVSIAALFMAGYIPGIMVGLALMLVCFVYAKMKGYPLSPRLPLKVVVEKTVAALPSLFLIFLVIGGIVGGVFTATEAGAIAVVYSLLLAVVFYKEVDPKTLPDILLKAAETTAIVMLLIAASTAMSWLLSFENIPQTLSNALLSLSDNPLLILLLINLLLIVVGAFLDMTPAVLIFTPIFLPVAVELGMSELHFGIMLVLNLSIGLCSPPVGAVLFITCAIAKTKLENIIRPLIPLYIAMFVVLMLVTYVSWFSEALPRALGF
ncbi:MAG: TRAP transporter large permease [Alteromonadaceae bacterium TMED7]|uniref:TRAP transporter large permease protein n=1 Tax=Alteromonas mediterranea 615 TaxID=1300253 RepID=S5AE31_9ALTE|nr:TRAP transporter large permease [Alteromonas mediterranea]AGP78422.1 TRAP transporter DctM-like subunit [Alteromonas mediterranea 615]AGP94065.1 TRAP transporter DctM-like subunit [Alteromonas mediterranea U8]MBR9782894.1 TRAP transporter large permease [Gammaproteobacteria bacterium]RPH14890.1 MAG: TRAP transporter large permease [Alteromonadaceae bacterium TMED7]AGP86105.1 TRAP transporter DctM-like subunit [Alteromonas mediterranea U4]|tara:strand:- start:2444 stop:3739 length:1296 start_codon:yes stop_codon:yes gene_type:complete